MRRYEVDVPIHDAADQERQGHHVFTGRAAGEREALAAARNAYDRAVQGVSAGRPVSEGSDEGWGVCALRPDWVLDWHKATTTEWVNPRSLM